MTFDELLTQILDLLQRQGRVSYGALRRRFALDNDYLEDIKTELIDAQQVAVDEGGKVLVWRGRQEAESAEFRVQSPESKYVQSPRSEVQSSALQIPGVVSSPFDLRSPLPTPGLSEPEARSLDAGRSVAERRQLTVMFCELGRAVSSEERADPEDWR
ncbi:MAG: hypothetical protein FJ147_19765 [Deltaproteobacteria bacterium]|nr:hypothetical protein [Deltaproteobacteria bacterium]